MPYSPITIANEFIRRFIIDDKTNDLSPMKLQKLMFFAHGWYLAINKVGLINGEDFEAWKFGPVLPSVYHEFKCFAGTPIPKYGTVIAEDSFTWVAPPPVPAEDVETHQLIDKIKEIYGKFSAYDLSNYTHLDNTPWYEVYHTRGQNFPISNDLIREYFERQAGNSNGG